MRARVLLTTTAAAMWVVIAAQPASAAISAKVSMATVSGKLRVTVVLSSSRRVARRDRPASVTLVAGGRSVRLKRTARSAAAVSLGTWSATPSGASATALAGQAGKKVTLRVRSGRGRTSTLHPTLAAFPGGTTPGGTTPGGTTPGGTTPGGTTPFGTPGTELVGQPAYDAIKGFLADSTFTDCPAGWPNCAVESRYGHFANGNVYYCRLTNTSGSDIINGASPITQILGAEQHADGSWAVSYARDSYGNTVYYTWRVSATGAVTGLYWGPGTTDPSTQAPTEQITGLVWVRGARDCSY